MRRLFTLFPLAFANAAQADTTATYANPGAACSMTVKIASNGDLRAEMKGNAPDTPPGRTYYFVGGEDYFVDPTDNGSVVMRVGDVAHVMAEQFAKVGFPSFAPRTMTLVRQGTISIRRWSGDAY